MAMARTFMARKVERDPSVEDRFGGAALQEELWQGVEAGLSGHALVENRRSLIAAAMRPRHGFRLEVVKHPLADAASWSCPPLVVERSFAWAARLGSHSRRRVGTSDPSFPLSSYNYRFT